MMKHKHNSASAFTANALWASPPFQIFLLFCLTLAIYSNTFTSGFHYDDVRHILKNPLVADFSYWPQIFSAYRQRTFAFLTFVLNYRLSGFSLPGFHAGNILIHFFSGCAVLFLTKTTLETTVMKTRGSEKDSAAFAVLAALVFISHPLQTQAVTYIIQRFAELAALFYLVSVLCYAKARLEGKNFYYFLSGISAALALLSKENAVTLPFAILLYEIFFLRSEENRVRFMPAILYLIFCSLVLVLIYQNPSELKHLFAGAAVTEERIPRRIYLMTQFNVIRTYIRLLFLPLGQNLDYDFPLAQRFLDPGTFASFILLAALAAGGFLIRKAQPLIAFGIFWFFLTLSVESSIFPIADVIFEHRLYLPMFGFALVWTELMRLLFRNTKVFVIAVSLSVLIYSGLTYFRNRVWLDDGTLWADVIRKSPEKPRGYIYLGLYDQEIKEYARAEERVRKGLDKSKTARQKAVAYGVLGAIAADKNDDGTALEMYTKALEFEPGNYLALQNQAKIYGRRQMWEEALAANIKARDVAPNSAALADVYNEIGVIYAKQGKYPEAIEAFAKGLESDEKSVNLLRNTALARIQLGEDQEAGKEIEKLRTLGEPKLAGILDSVRKKALAEKASAIK